MTYKRIGDYENLKIVKFSDASYKMLDGKVRSVEGRTNREKACPIMWKNIKIPRVCNSTKTAETLAADKTTDDTIYFAVHRQQTSV